MASMADGIPESLLEPIYWPEDLWAEANRLRENLDDMVARISALENDRQQASADLLAIGVSFATMNEILSEREKSVILLKEAITALRTEGEAAQDELLSGAEVTVTEPDVQQPKGAKGLFSKIPFRKGKKTEEKEGEL